ncbi:MAG: phosphoglycerate kinase [Candidatus Uhrbacteria bacterium GW2011_GWF2_39_13]|uniref:Phosphoglycerate kinase n=1 Tax=Candidatus Uhrbacteria bacterium GW2011_GWF2_39_13 TaxID=1618995 RepID=A0A0G0MKE2_9BACT|nr:MAG: phosphoglycerate kinase [Candidatus Uhrbacteria bacterium GW2011_GWF2_39_13]
MKLRKLGNTINLKGKRVLIRIDANVPVVGGRVQDGPHGRIARCAVDINWLAQRGAKVIIMAHLGRPKGRRVSAYSLKPVAKRLSGLLGSKIKLTRSVVGKDVEKSVAAMQEGDILLLENLRFDSREEENAPSFAEALAKFGDLYVNDAFSVSHRAHASIDAIASNLPSYAGPLLAQEISVLSRLEQKAKHPFVLVLGGLKMSTKLPIIKRFIDQLDTVLIGGALANIFLVAQGLSVGKSIFEEGVLEEAKLLLNTYGEKIILPVDVVCARSLRKDAKKTVCSINQINEKDRIVDIGPQTQKQFHQILQQAKTIVWNGPLGYCEISAFAQGTQQIANVIARQTEHATTIVGGGDTLPVIESFHLADKFTLLSTGGAALLQFLSGEALPGIDALKIS